MSEYDLRYSAMRKAVIETEFARLNDMQREAVFKTEGPLLLLAGAGSGKTTVLINRIINLLRFGRGYESETAPPWATQEDLALLAEAVGDPGSIPEEELLRLCAVDPPRPYEIIAITFTNKAAKELRERLNTACPGQAGDVWAHTFHTACLRILRGNLDKLGYGSSFTIYDEDDKKKLMTAIIRDLGYDDKKFEPRGVISEISRAKDNLVFPDDYCREWKDDYYRKTVGLFYTEYQKRMRLANALDFDDIICKTVELLQGFSEVRDYYQNKFRYVLVDEYQDTNHAQYVLCSLLAGKWRNLCVVGDDDQSIYKFRGATITNILEFEEQYPDAVTIRLEQNYRSTANILEAANHVIAKNSGRKGKTLWTDSGQGEKLRYYCGETQEEEANYIAKRIQQGYQKGDKLRSFTILYRNHALSNSLEMAFRRNSIPYRIIAGLRFLDRAEVKDVLAYLHVISNPADSVRMDRIINNPPRKIGAKTIDALARVAAEENISTFGAAENARMFPELAKSADALGGFTRIINDLIEVKFDLTLTELYDQLLEKTGFLRHLEAARDGKGEARVENVMELKSNIADYCANNEFPTLEGFLEEIALLSDIDRFDAEADAVSMMTMHSAKGLEFDTVFICGCEEGIFPSYRSMEKEEEIEEERRLCYVGMTRARKELHITCAKRRLLYGQTAFYKPSRFIQEIPGGLMEEMAPRPSVENAPQRIGRPAPKKVTPAASSFAGSFGGAVEVQAFAPGDRIVHKRFGPGAIKNATPAGGDTLLEIGFESGETKLMMAKTASQFIEKK